MLTILTIENLDFGRGHGRNFDHLTMVFLKFLLWSWSKFFDHMTMTPGRRPNGQKIMVALPPPPLITANFVKRSDVWKHCTLYMHLLHYTIHRPIDHVEHMLCIGTVKMEKC